MTRPYQRRPGPHRLHDPYRQIYRARVGCYVVRVWVPKLKGLVYVGTAPTAADARRKRDEFLRAKGLL